MVRQSTPDDPDQAGDEPRWMKLGHVTGCGGRVVVSLLCANDPTRGREAAIGVTCMLDETDGAEPGVTTVALNLDQVRVLAQLVKIAELAHGKFLRTGLLPRTDTGWGD